MTEPLNFTTKALEGFAELRERSTLGLGDQEGVDFLSSLLRRAEVFILPDSGELLDRSKVRTHLPGVMYKPPFPVVALEYRAEERPDQGRHALYEATDASRRIALCWEWDGIMPRGMQSQNQPEPGSGVVIASICWIDQLQMWVPFCGAMLLPYEYLLEDKAASPRVASLLGSGRISKAQANAPGIRAGGVLPLLPSMMQKMFREFGQEGAFDLLSSDLMDEVNAYLDLASALSCKNVEPARQKQEDRLNRARIKRGRLPFKDFHILILGGADYGTATRAGFGGGVRSHLRRGHIRRLSPDRITWVNAAIVRGRKPGFVDKAYAPTAAQL